MKLGTSNAVRFSPDGRRIAVLSSILRLVDVDSGKRIYSAWPIRHPSHLAFSPDGRWLVVKSTTGRIVVLRSEDGSMVADFRNDEDGEGAAPSFSPCGQYLVDGSWDGTLRVRTMSTGEVAFVHCWPGEMITQVQPFACAERWLFFRQPVATTNDGPPADGIFSLGAWPLSEAGLSQLPIQVPFARDAAISRDGTRLAVLHGAPPRNLSVYDVVSRECVATLEVPEGKSAKHIAWLRDDSLLGCVGQSATVLIDVRSKSVLRRFDLKYPSDVAVSPDGKMIALGDWEDGRIERL